MANKKRPRGYLTDLEQETYDRISIRAGKEGWKVASFLRSVLERLLKHDEAAEYLLDEHLNDSGKKRRYRKDDDE